MQGAISFQYLKIKQRMEDTEGMGREAVRNRLKLDGERLLYKDSRTKICGKLTASPCKLFHKIRTKIFVKFSNIRISIIIQNIIGLIINQY